MKKKYDFNKVNYDYYNIKYGKAASFANSDNFNIIRSKTPVLNNKTNNYSNTQSQIYSSYNNNNNNNFENSLKKSQIKTNSMTIL